MEEKLEKFSWIKQQYNVLVAKKDTKRSSNTLLRLVSFFATQTLAGSQYFHGEEMHI